MTSPVLSVRIMLKVIHSTPDSPTPHIGDIQLALGHIVKQEHRSMHGSVDDFILLMRFKSRLLTCIFLEEQRKFKRVEACYLIKVQAILILTRETILIYNDSTMRILTLRSIFRDR